MPPPRRPVRRGPGRPPPPAGTDPSIVPSFRELLALLSPFAGALLGWWIGAVFFGGIWFGLLGGLFGTAIGAVVARRGAPEILP